MNTLTIFYDPACGLCTNFRRWLLNQEAYLPLEFLPYQSEAARARCPQIEDLNPGSEIVVMADGGRWWQGSAAWLTCLWALRDYREWSFRLAHPTLLPLVEQVCHLLSQNRYKLSQLLRLSPEQLRDATHGEGPLCSTSGCTSTPENSKNAAAEKKTRDL